MDRRGREEESKQCHQQGEATHTTLRIIESTTDIDHATNHYNTPYDTSASLRLHSVLFDITFSFVHRERNTSFSTIPVDYTMTFSFSRVCFFVLFCEEIGDGGHRRRELLLRA